MFRRQEGKGELNSLGIGVVTLITSLVTSIIMSFLTADLNGNTLIASLARNVEGKKVSNVSADVTGGLCDIGGAHVKPILRDFSPGETLKIYYKFVPVETFLAKLIQ